MLVRLLFMDPYEVGVVVLFGLLLLDLIVGYVKGAI